MKFLYHLPNVEIWKSSRVGFKDDEAAARAAPVLGVIPHLVDNL
jgi:hypothetical protein